MMGKDYFKNQIKIKQKAMFLSFYLKKIKFLLFKINF